MRGEDPEALERRLHRAAWIAATGQEPDEEPDEDEQESARARRLDNHTMWVEIQVQQAMRRGDFDDLPGAGKPIRNIDRPHDPDWWVKSLIERERITGVMPPALALRVEDAELEETIDRQGSESEARRILDDFNHRVVEARRQLQGGPPVITAVRDVDAELEAWRTRRESRLRAHRESREQAARDAANDRRRWWQRRRMQA